MGAFEDVSEDLERTIKAIAKSRETGQPAVSEEDGSCPAYMSGSRLPSAGKDDGAFCICFSYKN